MTRRPVRLAGPAGRVGRAIRAQGALFVLQLGNDLLQLPLLLWAWGGDAVGDWVVLVATVELLSLADLSMQTYFGNRLTLDFAEHGRPPVRVAAIMTGVYGCIAALVLLVAAAVASPAGAAVLGAVTGVTDPGTLAAAPVLMLALAIRLPVGAIGGYYRAQGDAARGVWVLGHVRLLATFGGLAAVLTGGGGAFALAWSQAAVGAGTGVLVLADLRHRYGVGFARPALPDRRELRDMVDKGLYFNLNSVAVVAVTHGLVLLTGRLAATDLAVLVYTTARTVSGMPRQLCLQLTQFVAIEQSRLTVRGKHRAVRRLAKGTLRFAASVCGALVGFVLVAAEPWMAIWTHGQVPFDGRVFAILGAMVLATTPAMSVAQLHFYASNPKPLAHAYIAAGVTTLVLAAMLIPSFGAVGAAAGLLVGDGLWLAGWLLPRTLAELGTGWRTALPSAGLRQAASAVFGAAVAWGLRAAVEPASFAGFLFMGAAWSMLAVGPVLVLASTPRRVLRRVRALPLIGAKREG